MLNKARCLERYSDHGASETCDVSLLQSWISNALRCSSSLASRRGTRHWVGPANSGMQTQIYICSCQQFQCETCTEVRSHMQRNEHCRRVQTSRLISTDRRTRKGIRCCVRTRIVHLQDEDRQDHTHIHPHNIKRAGRQICSNIHALCQSVGRQTCSSTRA